MTDPKLDGAPILKSTLCHLGEHVFIFTGAGSKYTAPPFLKCNCGTYTYSEWTHILEMVAISKSMDEKGRETP